MVYISTMVICYKHIILILFLPNLSELRNLIAVGPVVLSQTNFGALYFPFPPKSTRRPVGFCISWPYVFPLTSQKPCTFLHPLLNPASTILISSQQASPFSVSHSFPVTGSNSIPKLFRNPYA